MLNDPGSSAADHEARNECLIDIDESWELCRDTVDVARISLEEALESSRTSFEAQQQSVAEAHREALEGAWSAYKRAVTETPATRRRELITEARNGYNLVAKKVRRTYDTDMATATEEHAKARRAAWAAYEVAVDEAFSLHRAALQDDTGDADTTKTGGSDDGKGSFDPFELVAASVARESERRSGRPAAAGLPPEAGLGRRASDGVFPRLTESAS
ncbi:MAG: hypothetical protein ACYDGN_01715 [Acidimicrobiales bacterium]